MIVSAVLFLAILGLFARSVLNSKNKTAGDFAVPGKENAINGLDRGQAAKKCADCVRRNLDGVYVEKEEANRPLAAIMIDNHPSARPLAGLDKAGLVYEAEVEGNYTRLLAVFSTSEEIKEIGPVRSARPYFAEWADELNAVYVHCGGSPEALVKIAQRGIDDLNEFYNGQYFWRPANRKAPHNIFISSANLNKFFENKSFKNGDYSLWQFKDDKAAEDRKAANKEIKINFRHEDFRVSWNYDEIDNDYIRYAGSAPELTAENNVITAKNVLIQIIPAEVIDGQLRLKMETVGSGQAVICLDGECRAGGWAKAEKGERARFYYADGDEVSLNAGAIWVEIVRPEVEIAY